MISWFKKPKLVFECLIPGVEKVMPIIPAKDVKHAWVRRAIEHLKADKNNPEFYMRRELYTAKCPGIFSLQRHGWVLRTWQDITIETFGDGERVEWASAIDQAKLNPRLGDYIGFHPKHQFFRYMDNWPNNTVKTVIKIESPWRCKVPKGYYLMEMPVAYSDENRFTTLPGYFSHENGFAPLNVQLLWHVMEGKALIKAGTPIAQYVLVPKENFAMDIFTEGKTSAEHVQDLLMQNKFIRNYGEIRRFYGEKK